MTDCRQILKTLYKLMTRPGPIYSRSNTKQDPVCLWLIVKIHSSRFPQLRKASTGSGNCSCVCQATLNPLSSSSSLLLWARKAKHTKKKQQRKYNMLRYKQHCLGMFGCSEVSDYHLAALISKNPPPPKAKP